MTLPAMPVVTVEVPPRRTPRGLSPVSTIASMPPVPPATAHPRPAVTALDSSARVRLLDPGALWRYRELIGFLALRDIQVRYKQTLLGAAWAVIQPLALMTAVVLFRRLLGRGGGDNAVAMFAAVLPWTFFAAGVTAATNSVVSNAAMVRKVYFPRLIMPLASLGAPLLDTLLCYGVLGLMMILFGAAFGAGLLLLPLLAISALLAVLGIGILLAALTVAYRDFRHVIGLLLQLWFFATPVLYALSEVPLPYRWYLYLNPIGGTVDAFRAVVAGQPVAMAAWAASAAVSLLCLLVGLAYFARAEKRFADVI